MEPAERPQAWVPPDEREISLRRRLAYFATAWAIALGLTWVVTIPDPVMIVAAPFFPGGLFFFLPREAAVVAGWASYLILSFFLLSARTWGLQGAARGVVCAVGRERSGLQSRCQQHASAAHDLKAVACC
jgi:hypothetical protein